uniref:AlNc14C353G10927 protein n=1 Tax=Albugo laibachii Nc14 TaxID=890382 RepID=F0WXH6_9STRA|nr:AlNc14C353G10927 [Albugo laibachii Nc14]|eukprot:CCA26169.1 AlNc14C353G10927 [Albugo laibachii Nc14]
MFGLRKCHSSSCGRIDKEAEANMRNAMFTKILPDRELNPGPPRDRQDIL